MYSMHIQIRTHTHMHRDKHPVQPYENQAKDSPDLESQSSPKSPPKTNPGTTSGSRIAESVSTGNLDVVHTSIRVSGPAAQTQQPVGANNENSTPSVGNIHYMNKTSNENTPFFPVESKPLKSRLREFMCYLQRKHRMFFVGLGTLSGSLLILCIAFGVCLNTQQTGIAANPVSVVTLTHE